VRNWLRSLWRAGGEIAEKGGKERRCGCGK
jgi:hypothetical protein